MSTTDRTTTVEELCLRAKKASAALAGSSNEVRKKALLNIAQVLEENNEELVRANQKDLSEGNKLMMQGKLSDALYHRLRVDAIKMKDLKEGATQLAEAEDPIGKITLARELADGLNLYKVTCPIGVVAVIFEARPDALVQIACLCIKSGNAVILKGGKEADHTNRALFDCIQKAIVDAGLPAEALSLVSSREDIAEILKLDNLVDLIVPRGGNELVRHIQSNTRIPVLGHAEGICHIYIDRSADQDLATKVIVDAKIQYAAACNAVETLLVDEAVAKEFFPVLLKKLKSRVIEARIDAKDLEKYVPADQQAGVKTATESDWRTEYSDCIVSIKTVAGVEGAIDHINSYGSAHTDAIMAKDENTCNRFFSGVNSAGVFINASTRFADGFRYGFGAEVGIATGKLHPRGPVGVDGLVTYKYKLVGQGHIVEDYTGEKAKPFTHRDLPHPDLG